MMETLQAFHFLRPGWLLLAIPAIGLWWIWKRSEDPLRGWREQMDPELLGALLTGGGGGGGIRVSLVLLGWLLATVSLAGPTWRPEPSPFAEDASPLVVLLKADESMNQTDPAPSRLERAQLKITDLAEARKGQPLALIAYAGTAHLVLPPTKDTSVVAGMAAEISPEMMPSPGDRLDLALVRAGEVLANQDLAGSIVVLTDSVDGDLAAAVAAHRKAGRPPIRFLALNLPASSEDTSLRAAARALGAKVETLTADDTDIRSVVRFAARPPVSRSGGKEGEQRWQEGGWYLVPLLALLVALGFRRETSDTPLQKEATA